MSDPVLLDSAAAAARAEERCQRIARAITAGRVVDDSVFDAVYSLRVRAVSSIYWTPVEVAVRASKMLAADRSYGHPSPWEGSTGPRRVLDVGSGAGKLCILGALVTEAEYTGIEREQNLVRTARATAMRLGASRARFVHGHFRTLAPADYDAIYLFNPFRDHPSDIEVAARFLAHARAGTRVMTYHGFGGEMPDDYALVRREAHDGGHLELWIKAR